MLNTDTKTIHLKTSIDITTISQLKKTLDEKSIKQTQLTIDFADINKLDSAGALFILSLERRYQLRELNLVNLSPMHEDILSLVRQHSQSFIQEKQALNKLELFGKSIDKRYLLIVAFLEFMGELLFQFFLFFKSYKNIRIKEILYEMYDGAIKAIPIIALTMFLVGVVIAYQSSVQLKIYGASIFIVDMLGISILRELAPMLAAIVIAGRNASAYSAQIGVMKITQELDAMKTMGLEPMRFLIIPKIVALMLMMSILIFVADIFGIMGGMLISNIELSITPSLFLQRFVEVVEIKHLYIGLFKAPFFALIIASIGIFRGLMVKDDTISIGHNTTKSVVESLFAVIVCDAVFSIIFTHMGL